MNDELKIKIEKTSKYFKGFFPLEKYVEEAHKIVEDCFDRHDTPRAPHPKVADLDDRHGDGLVNSNGYSVAGIIATEDYHVGGPSPATPILIGSWAFMFGLCEFLVNIEFYKTAAVVGLISFIAYFMVIGAYAVGFLIFTYIGQSLTVLSAFLPGFGGMATGIIEHNLGSLFPWICKFAPLIIPYVYCLSNENRHAQALAEVGTIYNGAALDSLRNESDNRVKQMGNALKQNARFNQLGVATGMLSRNGDNFAPDPDLPFGQTVEDMSRHGFIFGETGSGKTTLIKNLMAGVIKDEIFQRRQAELKEAYGSDAMDSEVYKQLMIGVDEEFAETIKNRTGGVK